MNNDNDKLVRDVLGEDAGTFQELVEAVLNNECTSTLPAVSSLSLESQSRDLRCMEPFIKEEDDAYEVNKSRYFGIRKSTFCDICSIGA